jgi:DNA primase
MCPHGTGGGLSWIGPVATRDLPADIATVRVVGCDGEVDYIVSTERSIEWLVRLGAVELRSWTPVAARPDRAQFVHVSVGPRYGAATKLMVREACMVVRSVLAEDGIQGILCTDGAGGYIIFIPFDDAPPYDETRDWLFRVAWRVKERDPSLCGVIGDESTEDLVQVGTHTNAPQRGAPLPYSLRASAELPMVCPLRWHEL